MRLRKRVAAIALAAATAAGGVALGQSAAPPADPAAPPDVNAASTDAQPRRVDVRAAPADDRPTPTDAAPRDGDREREAVAELYRAHVVAQLVKAPYLGVSTSPVPDALRQHLGLADGTGLVVDFVEKDSPAQAAGLKRFDILTRLDDQILINSQQLAVLVRSKKTDQPVKLALIRAGKEQSLSAKLVEKEVKPLNDTSFGFWQDPAPMRLDLVRPGNPPGGQWQARPPDPNRTPTPEAPHAGRVRRNGQGDRVQMVWRDNDSTLTVTQSPENPHRHAVLKDKSGKVVFEGDVDGPRDKLPPQVADKLNQLDSAGGRAQDPFSDPNVELRIERGGDRVDPRGAEPRSDGRRDEKDPTAVIRGDDVLHIALTNVQAPGVETLKVARVRDGEVRLPVVRSVRVEGLTPDQVEQRIVKAYAEAKASPDVSVRVERVDRAGKGDGGAKKD